VIAVMMAGAIGLAVPTTAQAAIQCGQAEGFSRFSGGALYRMQDPTLLGTPNTLQQLAQIGQGWGGFAWTGAGGDGVIYALTTAGKLLWYRHDVATSAWAKGSGAVIGTGFTPGTKMVNIAVGANGWIYTVRSDGKLLLFRHTGRLDGSASWAAGGGTVIGGGWTSNEIIAPQGDGTIYRQVGGTLYWFRHSDPAKGAVTWVNNGQPMKIGTGWRFYDLLALGGGVLLATSAPSGQVTLYQHADPVGGGQGWAITGLKKFVAKPDSFGVTMSPATCS
jgi:hypothetical protein